MHDFTLKRVFIDWSNGTIELIAESFESRHVIRAENLKFFSITLEDFWGPSVSILDAFGPIKIGDVEIILIELQSGDSIRIEAVHITIKSEARQPLDSTYRCRNKSEKDLFFTIDWESKVLQCQGAMNFKRNNLARFTCSKEQRLIISNEIKQIRPELILGESRRLQVIETKSGDRISIEFLTDT